MEEYKRVRYKKSPLLEVIFQLRFPTILAIDSTAPDKFQEEIREEYPFYQEGIEQQNEVNIDLNGNPSTVIKHSQNKNYSFISADNKWKINLTNSFIAGSTTAYTQWEDFCTRISPVIKSFEQIYRPAFYTRAGLRYINAITKSNWGLEDKKWSELLQPYILGVMTEDTESGTRSYLSETEYKNPESESYTKVHIELVHINDSPETSLLIDCDYFSQNIIQKHKVKDIATTLHLSSSNFIGKAITSMLNTAMEPEKI